MGTFLKEELNAKGTLTEDKRHMFLLLLLEPPQAWWGCLFEWRWRLLQHQCCLGAGKEPKGSTLPAEGALLSSMAFSWGIYCRLRAKGGLAGQDQELWRLVSSSWLLSVVLAYCSRQSQRVLLRFGCMLDFSPHKHPQPLWEVWSDRLSCGQCSGEGWEARRLGEPFGEASLLSASSLKCLLIEVDWWEDAGLHPPLP